MQFIINVQIPFSPVFMLHLYSEKQNILMQRFGEHPCITKIQCSKFHSNLFRIFSFFQTQLDIKSRIYCDLVPASLSSQHGGESNAAKH